MSEEAGERDLADMERLIGAHDRITLYTENGEALTITPRSGGGYVYGYLPQFGAYRNLFSNEARSFLQDRHKKEGDAWQTR